MCMDRWLVRLLDIQYTLLSKQRIIPEKGLYLIPAIQLSGAIYALPSSCSRYQNDIREGNKAGDEKGLEIPLMDVKKATKNPMKSRNVQVLDEKCVCIDPRDRSISTAEQPALLNSIFFVKKGHIVLDMHDFT